MSCSHLAFRPELYASGYTRCFMSGSAVHATAVQADTRTRDVARGAKKMSLVKAGRGGCLELHTQRRSVCHMWPPRSSRRASVHDSGNFRRAQVTGEVKGGTGSRNLGCILLKTDADRER